MDLPQIQGSATGDIKYFMTLFLEYLTSFKVCDLIVGASNSIDNFGCWIGIKMKIYGQQL